jgi:fructosamine-3-kinase
VTLPREVRDHLAEVIGVIDRVTPVGGGSFGSTSRIDAGGERYFLKSGRTPAADFYDVEATGLENLRSVEDGPRVPRVIAHHDDPGGWGWILLEWLEPDAASPERWERLGMGLARLHRAGANDGWGWERDGFLATLPQVNTPRTRWADFWAENRLRPQLERASHTPGIGFRAEWDRLFDALPRILEPAEADGPSYLHGDLWNGNVVMTGEGPALVDPSFYRGHREVDLAMAALFGGFSSGFRDAYESVWPLAPGYAIREAVYQLYYLLAHVNLFGGSYSASTASTLRAVLTSS